MNKTYAQWYEDAKVHEGKPEGLLAPVSPEVISKRWDAAMSLIRKVKNERMKEGKQVTLLDVGCGYADLYGQLNLVEYQYVGIEPTHWICEHAKKKWPTAKVYETDLKHFASEIIQPYDIVVALGVMATLDAGEEQQFAEDCMALAKHAVILSYQDATRYSGKFRSFTNDQVMELFATPVMLSDAVISDNSWDQQNWVIIRTK